MTDDTQKMDRDEALEKARTIWQLGKELETSGHRDLEARAAEIRSMAHYMLYDLDAGVEDER